jgi:hypothetical protein
MLEEIGKRLKAGNPSRAEAWMKKIERLNLDVAKTSTLETALQ